MSKYAELSDREKEHRRAASRRWHARNRLGIPRPVSSMPLECRSQEGITVGLLDSLIAIARIAAHRDLTTPHVVEALHDLVVDEDIKTILNAAKRV